MGDERARINASAERLITWLESQNYRGIDPYDALNSPLLGALGRRNRYVGIALTQIFRRSPINLRPLFGISPDYNPKAMGLFLASFVRRYAALREPRDLERANFFANWLNENKCVNYRGASWGYHFDWANRGFFAPRGTPTLVNTAFIAHALCDYAQMCDAAWAFDLARGACEFILRALNRFESADGICFSYTPLDTRYVYNANLLGAALLARVGVQTGERALIETAKRATQFTVRAQEANGSWKYGIAARDAWVDHFHTGFVLRALADVIDWLGQEEHTVVESARPPRFHSDTELDSTVVESARPLPVVSLSNHASGTAPHLGMLTPQFHAGAGLDSATWENALARGYAYWQQNFFRADGAPKYFPHSVYPIDAHSIAEAVLLSLRMQARDTDAALFATRELLWGMEHFQAAQGFFYYQIMPRYVNRIPYMRWSNAWLLRAFAEWLWHEHLD